MPLSLNLANIDSGNLAPSDTNRKALGETKTGAEFEVVFLELPKSAENETVSGVDGISEVEHGRGETNGDEDLTPIFRDTGDMMTPAERPKAKVEEDAEEPVDENPDDRTQKTNVAQDSATDAVAFQQLQTVAPLELPPHGTAAGLVEEYHLPSSRPAIDRGRTDGLAKTPKNAQLEHLRPTANAIPRPISAVAMSMQFHPREGQSRSVGPAVDKSIAAGFQKALVQTHLRMSQDTRQQISPPNRTGSQFLTSQGGIPLDESTHLLEKSPEPLLPQRRALISDTRSIGVEKRGNFDFSRSTSSDGMIEPENPVLSIESRPLRFTQSFASATSSTAGSTDRPIAVPPVGHTAAVPSTINANIQDFVALDTPNNRVPSPSAQSDITVSIQPDPNREELSKAGVKQDILQSGIWLEDGSKRGHVVHLGMPNPAAHLTKHDHVQAPHNMARHLADIVSRHQDGSVDITLKPEELGRIRMSMHPSDTGVVVSILAERSETISLMKRHIDQLAVELKQLGYENVGFDFSGGNSHENRSPPAQHSGAPEDPSPLPEIETARAGNRVIPTGLDMRL